MSFEVAKVYKDVTKAYILNSLNHQYRGKNYKFSDELITRLYSDFQLKCRNLDWLFQGQMTITLKPSAEDLFESLKKNQQVQDFMALLQASGYTVDQDNFISGYVLIDKQQMKFSKVNEIIYDGKPPVITGPSAERLTKIALVPQVNKYRPEAMLNNSKDFSRADGLVVNSHRSYVSVHMAEQVQRTWKTKIDTNEIAQMLNSSDVLMSLDINDYITCSEGGISSCMSMGSSSTRHLGWMMHFRSDFSIITFVHKGSDRFYKTGRTWTYLKLTEDGLPFARPFYKLSRTYGELNDGHIRSVDNHIQKQIEDNLGLSNPKKHSDHREVGYDNYKSIASPNMQNVNGSFNGTGYFDWPQDDSGYWNKLPLWEYKGQFPVTPFTEDNYSRGPVCLFNFPDALNVYGESTNESLFRNDPKQSIKVLHGWNERYPQFVECSVTKDKVLLRDTLELFPGVYIKKSIAIAQLAGKEIEVDKPVEEEIAAVAVVEVSDEDVVDF